MSDLFEFLAWAKTTYGIELAWIDSGNAVGKVRDEEVAAMVVKFSEEIKKAAS